MRNKIILVLGLLVGCATTNIEPNPVVESNSVRVAKMADQALLACGAGNVKTVSVDSFICKK